MKNIIILMGAFLFFTTNGISQSGGRNNFEFLQIPGSAIMYALGGVNITSPEDINLIMINPALISSKADNSLSLSYNPYFADVKNMSFTFIKDIKNTGPWGISANLTNYGDLAGYDASGNATDTYKASDFVVSIGKSHQIDNFRLGANIKMVSSNLAGYAMYGTFMDIGGFFSHPHKELNIGAVIKNMGFVFSNYTSNSGFSMPFNVIIGTTFKPEHLPFRLSITGQKLTSKYLGFNDRSNSFFKDIANARHHLIFGAEFILHKNFNLIGSFNALRNKELKFEQNVAGAGVSAGFMFKINRFQFSFSRAFYNAAGGTNSFTITSNLKTLKNK